MRRPDHNGTSTASPRRVEQHVQRQREQVVAVQRRELSQQRLMQHLPRGRIGAGDSAFGIDAQQAVTRFAFRRAGPRQMQQQFARVALHQRVLDAARRLRSQVPQFWPLGHLHAGEVEHADAVPLRPEERRASAAIDTGGVEEMFAAVQPDRLVLGQRRADGSGADRALRQVDADACDVPGVPVGCIGAAGQAADVDDDAVGVGQDREIAGVGDGTRKAFDDGSRRGYQGVMLFGDALCHSLRNSIESDEVLRPLASVDATLP